MNNSIHDTGSHQCDHTKLYQLDVPLNMLPFL